MSDSKKKNRRSASQKVSAKKLKDEKKYSHARTEDHDHIRRAIRGDQKAFRKLQDKYYLAIYNLIYRMISEKEEVEDLTQEAFIKAFASLSTFSEEYAFSTWLYKIATNNCIDYIRRKKLQAFSINRPIATKDDEVTFELPDSTYEPDRDIISHQRKKLVEEAILSLPTKYREVIRLRHSEEKEYQEIAEILNLPLGTVKAHIFRARELLYKYLKDRLRHY